LRTFADYHAALAVTIPLGVHREEYLDHVTFRANRRPLFTETFGPLVGLKEEWRAQGATPDELDLSAFRYRAPKWWQLPVNTGWLGGQETILEETAEHVIGRDRYGRRVKLIKASATLPLPLDYPVRTMNDWLRVKEHYTAVARAPSPPVARALSPRAGSPRYGRAKSPRYGDIEALEALARQHRDAGEIITVGIPGGFDEPRQLMGEEALCMAFYEQPELVHDMLDTFAATAERVLDEVSARIPIDQLDVHEDFAGKSGPLAGPRQIEAFIAPYYRRAWGPLSARGARVFNLDSDGDINAVLPALLAAGVNMVWPMEPAAHMDIVSARRAYGSRLAFLGGIDKHVLRESRAAIDAELERKLPPMIASGGCVLGLDHRIPNGTPLENYRHYIRKAWEILEG
jgi:hypothetical protein